MRHGGQLGEILLQDKRTRVISGNGGGVVGGIPGKHLLHDILIALALALCAAGVLVLLLVPELYVIAILECHVAGIDRVVHQLSRHLFRGEIVFIPAGFRISRDEDRERIAAVLSLRQRIDCLRFRRLRRFRDALRIPRYADGFLFALSAREQGRRQA